MPEENKAELVEGQEEEKSEGLVDAEQLTPEQKQEILETMTKPQLLAGLKALEVNVRPNILKPELVKMFMELPFLPHVVIEEDLAENGPGVDEDMKVGEVILIPIDHDAVDAWYKQRQELLKKEQDAKAAAEAEAAAKAGGTREFEMKLDVRMDKVHYEKGQKYHLSTEVEGKLRDLGAI